MEQPAPQPPDAPAVLYGLDGEQARSQMRGGWMPCPLRRGTSAAGKTAWALWAGAALCGLLLLILLPGLWRLPGAALLAAQGPDSSGASSSAAKKRRPTPRPPGTCKKLLDDYQVAAPEELGRCCKAYQARWVYRRAWKHSSAGPPPWRPAARPCRESSPSSPAAGTPRRSSGPKPRPWRPGTPGPPPAGRPPGSTGLSASHGGGHRRFGTATPFPTSWICPRRKAAGTWRRSGRPGQTRSQLDACHSPPGRPGDRLRLEAQKKPSRTGWPVWSSGMPRSKRSGRFGAGAAGSAKPLRPQNRSRAREILSSLTLGRYDRLLLDRDLSCPPGPAGETRCAPGSGNDGTVDQLYLALRLAVSRALLPGAPLVLDDALTRFDDRRLAAALELFCAGRTGRSCCSPAKAGEARLQQRWAEPASPPRHGRKGQPPGDSIARRKAPQVFPAAWPPPGSCNTARRLQIPRELLTICSLQTEKNRYNE